MKILIAIGENLYHYQRLLLAELIPVKDVEIYALSCNDKSRIPEASKLFRMINSKFPVFKTDPYSFENTGYFIAGSAGIESYSKDLYYDYVLNFCESTVIENFKIKYGQILNASMEIRSWYSASINKSPYTTINLLISADNENFVPFKSLSFSTEIGIYNNRDKALYYFSYLVKSVFNANIYPVMESVEKDYHFLKNWTYQFKLLKIIFLRKFSKTQFNWKIAVLENNVPQIITMEKGAYWADPFIVSDRENRWVFFEELDRKTRLGKISVINLQDNKPIKKEVVLEKPYHLSFPNVFKQGEDYYMMPEESESGEQNIYKATSFPYVWEKFKTILKGISIVDPVFIFSGGRYWLFFNKIEDFEYENNERLYLYSSADLFSEEWESHPQNPVIINKKHARNAGKIIFENGKILRPAQSCLKNYGESLSLREVKELNRKTYVESQNLKIEPPEGFAGLHTFNKIEEWKIFDLLKKE